ncbi:MAG: methyl-accepting chemotaxis protein [Pontixanthobacter sp.]
MQRTDDLNELDRLRRTGVVWIAWAGWLATVVLGFLIPVLGIASAKACLVSAIVNLLPSYSAWKQRFDAAARNAIALMAAAQPALLLYAMRGSEWQLDMHMYFFVALATLTVLCDIRPIIAASVLIAVHHLVLSFAAPSWVFSGGGGLGRVAIHALAVILQATALCFIATRLASMFARLHTARDESAAMAVRAQDAQKDAEAALVAVEAEREQRLLSERGQADRRKAELIEFADEFESSVAQVANAVGTAARSLSTAAETLDTIAHATGQQASDVASSANQAFDAVRNVAESIKGLSGSINTVADSALRQSSLSEQAGERSTRADEALRSLTDRSNTIGTSTETISRIANTTNILALNATIEAAAAGDAGRAFAVVATEVKDLSKQVALATEEINHLLSAMNSGVTDAETSFTQIATAIDDVTKAALAIKREVHEQRRTAADIEDSALQTTQGVNQISDRIGKLVTSVGTTEELSGQVRNSASALLQQADTLQNATRGFVGRLRAA